MMSLPGSVSWEDLCVLLRGILAQRNESNTLPRQYLSQLGLSNTFLLKTHCPACKPPNTHLHSRFLCGSRPSRTPACFKQAPALAFSLLRLYNARCIHTLVKCLSLSFSAQLSYSGSRSYAYTSKFQQDDPELLFYSRNFSASFVQIVRRESIETNLLNSSVINVQNQTCPWGPNMNDVVVFLVSMDVMNKLISWGIRTHQAKKEKAHFHSLYFSVEGLFSDTSYFIIILLKYQLLLLLTASEALYMMPNWWRNCIWNILFLCSTITTCTCQSLGFATLH